MSEISETPATPPKSEPRLQPARKCKDHPKTNEPEPKKTRIPKSKKTKSDTPKKENTEKKNTKDMIRNAFKWTTPSKVIRGKNYISDIAIESWITDNFSEKDRPLKWRIKNAIAKMVESGELIKFGNRYSLSTKKEKHTISKKKQKYAVKPEKKKNQK